MPEPFPESYMSKALDPAGLPLPNDVISRGEPCQNDEAPQLHAEDRLGDVAEPLEFFPYIFFRFRVLQLGHPLLQGMDDELLFGRIPRDLRVPLDLLHQFLVDLDLGHGPLNSSLAPVPSFPLRPPRSEGDGPAEPPSVDSVVAQESPEWSGRILFFFSKCYRVLPTVFPFLEVRVRTRARGRSLAGSPRPFFRKR